MRPSVFARILFAACALVVLAGREARAQSGPRNAYDGNWHFTLTPYVWLVTGVSGSLNFPLPNGGQALDKPNSSSLGIKFAFMGTAEARRGDWSAFVDLVYADLGGSKSKVKTLTGPGGNIEVPIDAGTKTGLQNTVLTFAGAYSLYHTRVSYADAFMGVRYLSTKASLDFNFSGPLTLLPPSGRLDNSEHSWDGIVGIKGHWGSNRSRWFLTYYGDVGTGQAALTGQIVAGPGYAFDWGDLFLVGRYLHYSNSGHDKAIGSLDTYGPAFGASFYF